MPIYDETCAAPGPMRRERTTWMIALQTLAFCTEPNGGETRQQAERRVWRGLAALADAIKRGEALL